ncbi:hypothetical protein EC968_009967 [Mortierella alpina]|nr:hypothetical protein EC968_009967 [Mortierella alpina]
MPSATIDSIFEIPELRVYIASYLTSADVAKAMATCHVWSEMLQPFLWTHFCPVNTLPDMSVLAQNLHHIRSIDLRVQLTHDVNLETLMRILSGGSPAASPTDKAAINDREPNPAKESNTPRCTNLKRIAVANELYHRRSNYPWTSILGKVLRNNHSSLTHLELYFHGSDDAALIPVMIELPQLLHLQHVTICTTCLSETRFMTMLGACLSLSRLNELFCHFVVEAGNLSPTGDMELDYDRIATPTLQLKDILDTAIAARTSLDGSISVKIKALRFPDPEREDIDLIRLVLPILRCGLVQLDTLEIPKFLDHRPEGLYKKIVRDLCPGLKHLIIPPYDYNSNTRVANYFIQAAAGLKTIRGDTLRDDMARRPDTMMQQLVVHHSETLEEVELMYATNSLFSSHASS